MSFPGLKLLQSVQSAFSTITGLSGASDSAPDPKIIVWIKYATKLGLLGLALFIFIWWPAPDFTSAGFEIWSERMSNLPDEVWLLLVAIILSWVTIEITGRRRSLTMTTPPLLPGAMEPDLFMDNPPLDGRFAQIDQVDPMMMDEQRAPNPVLEDWKNSAS